MCLCGLVGWFYLPLTSLGIVRKVEVASGQERIAKRTAWWPAGSLHAPQGKASHWKLHWPLEFSQEMTGAVSLKGCHCLNPGVLPKFVFYRVVLPRMSDGVTMQSPFSEVFPTQAGMGTGMIQPQGREEPKCPSESPFSLKIQDYSLQLAAYWRPIFQLPEWWQVWLTQLFHLLGVHQSPPPNLYLEIIPSFLVSFFFPLCLRSNEISWVCHPSPYRQQVVTSD